MINRGLIVTESFYQGGKPDQQFLPPKLKESGWALKYYSLLNLITILLVIKIYI